MKGLGFKLEIHHVVFRASGLGLKVNGFRAKKKDVVCRVTDFAHAHPPS